MNNYLTNPAIFLIQTPFNLFIFVVMLRIILQYTRADFYNPLSQMVVKLTAPVLIPMRRVIPAIGKIDTAAFVLLLVCDVLMWLLTLLILGKPISLQYLLFMSIYDLLSLLLYVYQFAIIILIVASWLSPGTYNPVLSVLDSITAPFMQPIRRIVPPLSGIDFSPMVAIMALVLLRMLLLPPLQHLAGQGTL